MDSAPLTSTTQDAQEIKVTGTVKFTLDTMLVRRWTGRPSKAQWERDVLGQLPKVLNTLTQGVDLITINSALLQKPGIQPELMQGLAGCRVAQPGGGCGQTGGGELPQ